MVLSYNKKKLMICLCVQLTCVLAVTIRYEHHYYDTMTQLLKQFATEYPTKTHLYSIGKSLQNRELWVMAIADTKPNESLPLRPEAKYVGNMHGNEVVGREILLHFINYLLTNQSGDSDVDYLLKNTRIHILPSMNPDGYEASTVGECYYQPGRENANGFDLNRNFPDLFDCQPVTTQIETTHVMNWLNDNRFLLSANFHTGALVVNYPYDNYANSSLTSASKISLSDDNNVFVAMSKAYAAKNAPMLRDACGDGFQDGITNGAEWYIAKGGMQDYNYWKHGCYEVTVELSCCFFPAASKLQGLWLDNKDALIEYLKYANTGIRGIVRFSNGQAAAKISVQINSIQPIFKTTETGEYYRILLPGTYNLSLLLNCTQVFSMQFTISSTTRLTELNITLNDAIYSQYESVQSNLDKYATFCKSIDLSYNCKKSSDNNNNNNINISGGTNIRSISLYLFYIYILNILV